MGRPFIKMNGLGNDFVVVEAGAAPFAPSPAHVRAIADREHGVGCDQLIAIERGEGPHPFMRIWNADGGEVEACGNGARCVAWLLMQASGSNEAAIDSRAGLLIARTVGDRKVTVDMGAPRLDWRDIPLAEEMDTRGVELQVGPVDDPVLHTPGCVSMGNPHVVFFVPEGAEFDPGKVGPLIENHPLFPEGVNVGFAQIDDPRRISLTVWERGAGLTQACGTAACAAVVAAHRRGLSDRRAEVMLPGGALEIEWREDDGHVLMTGPVAVEFTGALP
ncbi:MAG TPA: diaminopimelate epimerase [Caulobacteraceae bacterium]|jgi:diaminopimelate epimerase